MYSPSSRSFSEVHEQGITQNSVVRRFGQRDETVSLEQHLDSTVYGTPISSSSVRKPFDAQIDHIICPHSHQQSSLQM